MQIIENSKFKAEINEKGAELTHLYNLDGNFDYIWNNDLWPKHAPVLFPSIGRSEEDSYLLDGKNYEMPQHGFVADETFTVVENAGDKLVLSLKANDTTRKYYPFDFELVVTFTLSDEGLNFNFDVTNNNDREMSFSIGSHPAFNLPINGEGDFDDYKLTFRPAGLNLKQFEIVKTPNPYRNGNVIDLAAANGSEIQLNHDMFEKGLVIVENDGIEGITISSDKTDHQIDVSLEDFRYVCLWTKEGANAPFLCIEPFQGLPDVSGHKVELMEKEGNVILAANKTQAFNYQIKLS